MEQKNKEMAFVEQLGGKFERYLHHNTMGTLRSSNVDAICYEVCPTCS